jgi:hypothetical protein
MEGGFGEIGDELWSTPRLTTLITSYFQQISSENTLDLTLSAQNGDLDGSRPQMHLAPAIIVRRRTDRNLVRIFKKIAEQLNLGGEIPLGIERLLEIRDDRVGGKDRGGEEEVSGDVGSLYPAVAYQ